MKRSFPKKEIVSIVVKFNFNKAKEQIQILGSVFLGGLNMLIKIEIIAKTKNQEKARCQLND